MVEYFDFGANLETLLRTWRGQDRDPPMEDNKNKTETRYTSDYTICNSAARRRRALDPSFLRVRESVCLVGLNREALQGAKIRLSKLFTDPIPLESFHVKKLSDIRDGALLVPKIIFVAVHCPGKKLIDEDGNEGQLDFLYDEACEVGAEVMVIYMGLPKSIYPPKKHMVYHPKMAEMLFPTQSVLKDLATNNSLVTVTENCEFTLMQQNVLREWLLHPVGEDHQVYKTASKLTSMDLSFSDVGFWSESEVQPGRAQRRAEWEFEIIEPNFISATEEHPLADKAAKKKKKKAKKKRLDKKDKSLYRGNDRQLIYFDDQDEIEEYSAAARGGIEMNMYQDEHKYHNDEFEVHMTNSL